VIVYKVLKHVVFRLDVVYILHQLLSFLLNYCLLPGIVDIGNKVSDTSGAPCDTNEVNSICFSGSLDDDKGAKLIQASSSDSPTSSFPIVSNSPSNVKSATLAGSKRPASSLVDTWQCLMKEVSELQDEFRRKKQKVAEGKELAQNLVKKIDWLASEISDNLQLLRDNEKEKKVLMAKLERLEHNASRLQQELQKRTNEIEEGRNLQNQLLQQIDSTNAEMSKNKQQLEEYEKEKKLHMDKIAGLEGKINELQLRKEQ
jgi:uncharacterized phage infection (PIP) family protein YhgE